MTSIYYAPDYPAIAITRDVPEPGSIFLLVGLAIFMGLIRCRLRK